MAGQTPWARDCAMAIPRRMWGSPGSCNPGNNAGSCRSRTHQGPSARNSRASHQNLGSGFHGFLGDTEDHVYRSASGGDCQCIRARRTVGSTAYCLVNAFNAFLLVGTFLCGNPFFRAFLPPCNHYLSSHGGSLLRTIVCRPQCVVICPCFTPRLHRPCQPTCAGSCHATHPTSPHYGPSQSRGLNGFPKCIVNRRCIAYIHVTGVRNTCLNNPIRGAA